MRKRKRHKQSPAIPGWIYICLLAVIIGVVGFSVFKLLRWDMGTVTTEGVVEGDFEVEVLDQIFLLPVDKAAMKKDDGKETILFLGNDILTYYSNEEGVAEKICSKLHADGIKAGFPGSTVARKLGADDHGYDLDAYSFFNVAKSLTSGDFTWMDETADNFTDYTYRQSTDMLKNVDMSSVDTLVIFYDGQDYISRRIGMNPNDEDDPITYKGALNSGIKMILEKFPHVRIVCMSFPLCYAYDSEGSLVSGDRYDFGNGRLTTYLQFMIDVSGATGVSFIDNYYGTVHEDNSDAWLLDNIHLNAACNEHIAQHFVNAIYERK